MPFMPLPQLRGRLALLVAATLLATVVTAQQGTYQKAAQTVAVYATVLDRNGRLVPNLTKKDFQILDNGQPAEVTVFSNDLQSLTVALMLDMSDSMKTRLTLVRESTRRFIDALLPPDRLRIGTFAEEVGLSPLLTGDKAVLNRIIDEELWPGGTTPLWTAIDEAMSSFAGESSRRIVLTLTDGVSTAGRTTFDQVRQRAISEVVMVYVVGMEGTTLGAQAVQLADETGGGHFEVTKGTTLTATFARVANELTIEVRLTRPGLTARARKNYLAVNR
jgi:VWFA-related protein